MQVIKRDGQKQRIDPNKVIWRLRNLCALEEDMKTLAEKNPTMYRINKTFQPLANVDYEKIALETLRGLKDGVTTSELDDLAAFIAQPMSFDHPEYGVLAARIVISNYHKNTTMNLQHHFASQSGGPLAIDDIEKNILCYTIEAFY
jgi:ribonucleoside-diphosphate reductase alpha chain